MKYGIVLGLLFLAGCAAAIVYKSEGEELYYEKCGSCHRVYPKEKYSADEWETKIEEMSKRAKLNANKKRMIIDYLTLPEANKNPAQVN